MGALQKKLKQLRRKGKTLQQSATEKTSAVTTTIEEYAKAACRAFCEEVYHRFPREVRDMIYGHLHAQCEVDLDNGMHDWGNPLYFNSKSEAQWRSGGTGDPPDHWWNPEFMGALMVREISEHYFRTVCILFGEDFQSIPKFRVTDQWALGYSPCQVIANVGVCIQCGSYDVGGLESVREHGPGGQAGNVWGDTESPPHREPTQNLLLELELLFGFKQGTKITLRIWAKRVLKGAFLEKQKWMFDNILPFILPTLRRFEEVGYEVRVIISQSRWSKSNRDFTVERAALYPEEVNESFKAYNAFELRREQREQEMAEADEDFADGNQDGSEEDGEESSEDESNDEGISQHHYH